ncbi:hypothetical protein ACFCV3_18405 [Kribbella sp. NPDC056345]|uniref:hypothetical protein n=1 Tax=Kribbella sp. NPDC056345 TaxID=3345789 RepID=UPI0035DC9ED5
MSRTWAVIVLAGVALTACGGESGTPSGTPSSAPTTGSTATVPTTAPTPSAPPSTPEATPKDAATIAKALDLGKVHVWTAETDPNKLLGRPGSYTSAATVIDKRVACSDPARPDTACGARVEVFETPAVAKKRSAYIQGILEGGGVLGTEYHTVVGSTLLRVTGELTPKQAGVYAAKFKSVSG